MLVQVFRKFTFAAILVFASIGVQVSVWGQGDGQPPAPAPGGQTGGQGANVGATNANVTLDDGTVDLDTDLDITSLPDQRNQGFVGSRADRIISQGFIGASSVLSGPGLSEDATFGGGVNGNGAQAITGGGGGGGGGGGQQIGFTITRRGIRARLRPVFAFPQISAQQVVHRFDDHLSRQPLARDLVGQYSITIEQRTATLKGSVKTRGDADRLVRQLRLEPGVYKIVNQLQVLN